MSQFHSLASRNVQTRPETGKEDSTVLAASAISRTLFHHELTAAQRKVAAPAMHYGFGTAVGAMYGTLVEFAKPASIGWGTAFGAAVWLGAHVIVVPALGLSRPVRQSSAAEEATEFTAHVLYGTTAEGIRRLLRGAVLR